MPTRKRAWDEYDVYLFDIDGTLLNSADAIHYFAFCEALGELAGRPLNLDGVVAHGNTDVGILRDALRLAGVPEQSWRPKLKTTQRTMCDFVERRLGELSIEVLPGVVEVLAHLRGRGALLGVATGNLERIGKIKLQHCGLLEHFDFGGYSDAYEFRRDVFRGAVEQARTIRGSDASICVIGDTPEDVRSARANSLNVMAVATGGYSYDELAAESPDRCLHGLEELVQHAEPVY